MRYLIPVLGLLATSSAAAQSPVIGTGHFFQMGQSYFRDNYIPSSAFIEGLVAAGGPDYDVDLTPVAMMVNYGTEEVIRGSGLDQYTFYSDYYDTANVRISVYQGDQGFGTFLFLEDEQGIRHVGGQPNGVTWPLESMVMRYNANAFPLELRDGITYGFEHMDAIEGEWSDASGSDEHYVSGVSLMAADGYGTITMPDGAVITHTLRLRTAIAYTDSNALFGVQESRDTIFTWYAEGISGPLMTLVCGNYTLTSGYVSSSPLAIYHQSGAIGIEANAAAAPAFSIAPVPSSGPVRISIEQVRQDALLSIVDPTGRALRQWRVTAPVVDLDLSDLAAGHYRMVYQDGISRSVKALHILR